MKTNKLFFLGLILLLTFSCNPSNNNYPEALEKKLSDLHRATTEDMVRLSPIKWNADTEPDFYSVDGKKLDRAAYQEKVTSKQYNQAMFLDNNDKVKAVVMEPLNEESLALTNYANKEGIKVGDKVPDFNLTDINGNPIELEALKGKVVVLNFWFINCPPCRKEIPDLNKLADEFKDQEVVFIAVSDDDGKRLKTFFKKYPFNYTQISSKFLAKEYGIRSFPTNIVLNKNLEVVLHKIGGRDDIYNLLKEEIQKQLAL